MKAFIRLSGFLVISGALHADWSDYKAVSLSEAWAQAGVGPDQSVDTYIGVPQQYKFLVKQIVSEWLVSRIVKVGEFGPRLWIDHTGQHPRYGVSKFVVPQRKMIDFDSSDAQDDPEDLQVGHLERQGGIQAGSALLN